MEEVNSILNGLCVSVTASVTLTLVPCFQRSQRPFPFESHQGTALCIFTVLPLVDEIAVPGPGPESERIVLVCAAGLLAGPLVGTTVGSFGGLLAAAIKKDRAVI